MSDPALILPVLAAALVFGMFALTPRQVRGLNLFAVVLPGATMASAHFLWPSRFPVGEEAMHFMLLVGVLPLIAVLAGQLGTMRHKLREHRADQAMYAAKQAGRDRSVVADAPLPCKPVAPQLQAVPS